MKEFDKNYLVKYLRKEASKALAVAQEDPEYDPSAFMNIANSLWTCSEKIVEIDSKNT